MSDAAPTTTPCTCCKKEREKKSLPPRVLHRMPGSITRDPLFKRKTLALYLCEHCDSDTIDRVLRAA